ncbi:Sporulation initiation inhibitor protein Soj [invertebrate metagenome]|uniref:Sporulation initiation inhibitor protein Soj n=1 Tax=invertebrate metagenome TaxID=1711999 RepID=A0A2H9T660_9ZZZZ
MRRVVFNLKGGVGKTSITCNLAGVSASHGFKTLVVDLDPQGNSSHYLMGDLLQCCEYNLAGFFEQALSFSVFSRKNEDYIYATPFDNLYVMPSSPELKFLEYKLETKHKIYKLKSALARLSEQFDRIYVDTAPAFNFYTQSALIAADSCLIPFDCDDFSRQALYSILGDIRELQEDHNPDLEIEGIIVNQFDARAKLPGQMVQALLDEGLPVLPVKLTSSIKMKESHQKHMPLVNFDPGHPLTQKFIALHDKLEENCSVEVL